MYIGAVIIDIKYCRHAKTYRYTLLGQDREEYYFLLNRERKSQGEIPYALPAYSKGDIFSIDCKKIVKGYLQIHIHLPGKGYSKEQMYKAALNITGYSEKQFEKMLLPKRQKREYSRRYEKDYSSDYDNDYDVDYRNDKKNNYDDYQTNEEWYMKETGDSCVGESHH